MEDDVDVHLWNEPAGFLHTDKRSHRFTWLVGGAVASVYGLWGMFVFPGLRKVPLRLKVPFLPSSEAQTQNVMRLLEGRKGRLVDLGSGDGRLVFRAAAMGFQSTGYELNPILLTYARIRAQWKNIPPIQAKFLNQDLWTMPTLEKKLISELPADARVVVCRFPFPHWPSTCSEGSGLDQVWAYDMQCFREKKLPVLEKPLESDS
ncbi:ATP synthase subunit C lysine N-methyltransferase isoform X2 [Latimeria chalumnae]|uniref:ATP synthase subunit C lysine N-methyltransferase isoform X2 n=1 Tax=Latimeria chalumnae TaxID=7897 RepID=UPI0003C17064|nr:PREDICTED: protein FAM173B-like isoform X2 [Latimeria chalumnae]|eukprot:XP_005997655.1 PREDICTED: protein FAM173B-like isoform X2 [Latimeria chalumnae]